MAGSASTAPYHKRNLGWPLDRRGAGFHQVTLVDRYETALLHLARTPRGSLYSDMNYGSVLFRLRTQGVSDELLEGVLEDLRRGARAYIPDIILHDIGAEWDDNLQKLKVSVFWTISGANQQMHGELARTHTVELRI